MGSRIRWKLISFKRSFQDFLLRVLGLPELHAGSSPVKTPSIRSAVELSKEDSVSDALARENFRSVEGENSFHAAPRNFFNLGRVEFHAPPVITREEQAAREMQERAISPAAAQDKTAAASFPPCTCD